MRAISFRFPLQKGHSRKTSTAKWKILFQHHLVGGSSFAHHSRPYGDYKNYGRGGGRFARVGEQEKIHELMLRHGGRIIFKGHDHVYADEIVEGIHYTTCPRNGSIKGRKPRWTEMEGFETLYTDGFDPSNGYLRVTVSVLSLKVEFVNVEGNLRDTFDIEDPQ